MSRIAHDSNWPGYVRASIGVFPKVHRRLLRLIAKKSCFTAIMRSQRMLLVFLTSLTVFFRCSGKNFIRTLELVRTDGTVPLVRALSASFASGDDELDCLALVEHVVHGIS